VWSRSPYVTLLLRSAGNPLWSGCAGPARGLRRPFVADLVAEAQQRMATSTRTAMALINHNRPGLLFRLVTRSSVVPADAHARVPSSPLGCLRATLVQVNRFSLTYLAFPLEYRKYE